MLREGLERKARRANAYWHEDLQRKARCRFLAGHGLHPERNSLCINPKKFEKKRIGRFKTLTNTTFGYFSRFQKNKICKTSRKLIPW